MHKDFHEKQVMHKNLKRCTCTLHNVSKNLELSEHLKLATICRRQSWSKIFGQSTTCQYNYMYNIVQNGEFVITCTIRLPAI